MSPKRVLELALETRERLQQADQDATLILVDAIQSVIESERLRAARQTQVTIASLLRIFAAAQEDE